MHSEQLFGNANNPVVVSGKYSAVELVLTQEKVTWLWNQFNQYRTLFSDFTRGDLDNFINVLILPRSYWLEIRDDATGKSIGIIYLTDITSPTESICHVVFFDRNLSEKVPLCKDLMRYVFHKFGFHRLTAIVPDIYHATIRLAEKVGFKREGLVREALLIGNQWRDEIHFGILQSEVTDGSYN